MWCRVIKIINYPFSILHIMWNIFLGIGSMNNNNTFDEKWQHLTINIIISRLNFITLSLTIDYYMNVTGKYYHFSFNFQLLLNEILYIYYHPHTNWLKTNHLLFLKLNNGSWFSFYSIPFYLIQWSCQLGSLWNRYTNNNPKTLN